MNSSTEPFTSRTADILSARVTFRANATKRKRIIALVVTVVSLVLLGLAAYRIITLNMMYPSPKVLEYAIGDEIMGGDIGITVIGLKIYEGAEIYTVIPDYQESLVDLDGELLPIEKSREFVCEITYTNYSTDQYYRISPRGTMQIELFWTSNGDPMIFASLNPDLPVRSPTLGPGEQITVRLPFRMYRVTNYEEDIWESAMEGQIDLVIREFPQKIIVHLT